MAVLLFPVWAAGTAWGSTYVLRLWGICMEWWVCVQRVVLALERVRGRRGAWASAQLRKNEKVGCARLRVDSGRGCSWKMVVGEV